MKSYRIKIKKIEIESDNYHIITTIKIKNKILRFIMDTGATHTCMNQHDFIVLHPEEPVLEYDGDSVGISGSGFKAELATLRDFKMGRMSIAEQNIVLLDMQHVNQVYQALRKPKINGIIGCDFFVKYNAVIDFKNEEMILWKNS